MYIRKTIGSLFTLGITIISNCRLFSSYLDFTIKNTHTQMSNCSLSLLKKLYLVKAYQINTLNYCI